MLKCSVALDQIDSKRVQQVLGRWLLANGRNRAVLTLRPVEVIQQPEVWQIPLQFMMMLLRCACKICQLLLKPWCDRMVVIWLNAAWCLRGGGAAAPGESTWFSSGARCCATTRKHQSIWPRPASRAAARGLCRLTVEARLHETVLRVTCFPQDVPIALSLLIDPLRQPLMTTPP